MKKTFFGLLLLCVAFLTSCDKLDELTSYEDSFSATFTFSTQNAAGEGVTESQEITSTLKEDLKKNKLDMDKAEAKLLDLLLVLNTPDVTFADLKSAELYITGNGSEQKIAWNNAIPETAGNTLDLEVDKNVDIINTLGSETIKFKIKFVSRNAIKTDASATATVNVKISKK